MLLVTVSVGATCFETGLSGRFPAATAGLRGLDLSEDGFEDIVMSTLLLLTLLLRLLGADVDGESLLDERCCFVMMILLFGSRCAKAWSTRQIIGGAIASDQRLT